MFMHLYTPCVSLSRSPSVGGGVVHTQCVCVFTAAMADPVQAPKFEEHFWGPGNKGFDVLLHNYKVGIGATKELNEFIRER